MRRVLMQGWLWLLPAALWAAPPVITDLQPRGAQKGRPFTLTITGRELTEGAKVWSTLPAAFTPMAPEKTGSMATEGRSATFLVEPITEAAVGVYPIRVETRDGISNIQFFSVGAFPEQPEDESLPGALPNTNDSLEKAQPLPSGPITLNGTLRGPERDFFRLSAKAGERRVLEVEARRAGSAIDPVIRVLDGQGKVLAQSEDTPLLGLDARLEITFPRDGYYYVVLHDARYSTQVENYYRLKIGSFAVISDLFPLGGRRGQVVDLDAGGQKIQADLRQVNGKVRQTFVNLPGSPALPIPFAVGDDPEVTEPESPVSVPVTINGRLSRAGEVDRFRYAVQPGDSLMFQVEARELGTSKLMAVLTVVDENNKALGRAGDEPLAEDFFNVNQSRTAGDPFLRVQVPPGVRQVTVSIEDLALRGGPFFGYRLHARRLSEDFRLMLNTAYVNIPAGGSVAVPVVVERRGYDGDIQLRVANPPPGLLVEGGYVVAGAPVKENARNRNSRGVLILSAAPGAALLPMELTVEGSGRTADGSVLVRKAEGPGVLVTVAGATQQGSVDRQRALTAPWLNLDLPAALTSPPAATLALTMIERRRMEEGDQIRFRWKWTARDPQTPLPRTVSAEMVGAADVRLIEASVDPRDPSTGTFLMTTTRLTRPSRYDVYASGRLMVDGRAEDVVSRPISVEVEEVKSASVAETGPGR